DTAAPVIKAAMVNTVLRVKRVLTPDVRACSSPSNIMFNWLPKKSKIKLPIIIGIEIIMTCSQVRASRPPCNQYTILLSSCSFLDVATSTFIIAEKNELIPIPSNSRTIILCCFVAFQTSKITDVANNAPPKADNGRNIALTEDQPKKMAQTAPSAAPLDTPI